MASTTVNFNLKTAGYVNYANQTLTFTLLNAGAEAATGDQSYVTLPGTVTATSAANGDGSVSLFRNGKSGIDSVYEVVFPNRERAKFIIPAGSSTIELAALLVDNVPSGAATQQSSVYAAAIQRANHTGTQALSTISDASTIQLKPSEGAFANGDKTKLDAIAAGATGNQTDAQIRAAVEAATDSNVFTDADHTKLNGIEASATTDQTASEIRALVESATDSNVFTDADHTKLNSLDVNAKAQVNFVPRSISFTNTSAFLSVADHDDLDVGTGDFSFSFAARVSSASNAPVLQKNGSAGYAVFFDSGILKLTLNASGSSNFNLATGLNDNKWHTYVITVDRDDTAIAYVDGVAQTGVSVSGKAGDLNSTADFQIGLVGTTAGSGIALGNYVSLHKEELGSTAASNIYFSPDTALGAGSTQLMVDLRKADKTFTDVSTNGFAVTTNGTIIFNEGRITSLNETIIGATTPAAVTGTAVFANLALGYTSGTGGTVTQASSKTTAVTLNKINGEIVMNNAALADDATAAFTLTNNTIGPTSVVIVNVASGVAVAGSYQVTVGAVAAGSCSISVLNVSGASRTDTIKLNFAVIKAVKT